MALSGVNINDIEPCTQYNLTDAAAMLNMSRKRLWEWEKTGRIRKRRVHRKTGKKFFLGSDLRAMLL